MMHAGPASSFVIQAASRTLTTNQPGTFATRPYSDGSSGASGITRERVLAALARPPAPLVVDAGVDAEDGGEQQGGHEADEDEKAHATIVACRGHSCKLGSLLL